MNINKRDLKKLTKSQLTKSLLKQEKNGLAQKQIANEFENSIVSPPKQEESLPRKSVPKPTRKPPLPPPPKAPFNFDDDLFQTENQSLEKFKIIIVQSRQNKKFKSFTNEFKVKIF